MFFSVGENKALHAASQMFSDNIKSLDQYFHINMLECRNIKSENDPSIRQTLLLLETAQKNLPVVCLILIYNLLNSSFIANSSQHSRDIAAFFDHKSVYQSSLHLEAHGFLDNMTIKMMEGNILNIHILFFFTCDKKQFFQPAKTCAGYFPLSIYF